MTRKAISLVLLTALASGLVLALTGCFLFDADIDGDSDEGQYKVIDREGGQVFIFGVPPARLRTWHVLSGSSSKEPCTTSRAVATIAAGSS